MKKPASTRSLPLMEIANEAKEAGQPDIAIDAYALVARFLGLRA